MAYLDASVVVASVTDEPNSAVVRAWLRDLQDPVISVWTLTEVASALSIKLRTGHLTAGDVTAAGRQVEGMRDRVFSFAPIDETHFFAARRFAQAHETGLRAGDALHLAVAADYGLVLATMDRTMASGARKLGLQALLLPGETSAQ